MRWVKCGAVKRWSHFGTARRNGGAGKTDELIGNAMWPQAAYRMIQHRAADARIPTTVCNHTFLATGITAYLDNGGLLENAQAMAAHESPRTTKLYDRTRSRWTRLRKLEFKLSETLDVEHP